MSVRVVAAGWLSCKSTRRTWGQDDKIAGHASLKPSDPCFGLVRERSPVRVHVDRLCQRHALLRPEAFRGALACGVTTVRPESLLTTSAPVLPLGRKMASWMPTNGAGASTGESEPPAMGIPAASSEAVGYDVSRRERGSRSSTHAASVTTNCGCRLATTPAAAMRATRSGRRTWQCVRAGRVSGGTPACGHVNNHNTQRHTAMGMHGRRRATCCEHRARTTSSASKAISAAASPMMCTSSRYPRSVTSFMAAVASSRV